MTKGSDKKKQNVKSKKDPSSSKNKGDGPALRYAKMTQAMRRLHQRIKIQRREPSRGEGGRIGHLTKKKGLIGKRPLGEPSSFKLH